jgi:hypothetical protein
MPRHTLFWALRLTPSCRTRTHTHTHAHAHAHTRARTQGNDHLLRVHRGSDVEVFLSYFKPLCGHLIGTTPNIEVRPPLHRLSSDFSTTLTSPAPCRVACFHASCSWSAKSPTPVVYTLRRAGGHPAARIFSSVMDIHPRALECTDSLCCVVVVCRVSCVCGR